MKVKVGISNRHVHLSKEDFDKLFFDQEFYSVKDLSQTGEFMSNLKVDIIGPKGKIKGVRVVGPVRSKTQVEISKTDSFKLGVDAPVRLSGDLEDAADMTISFMDRVVNASSSCIIAKRHLHINTNDLDKYNLRNNDVISIRIPGERGGVLNNVVVRSKDTFTLEIHLDTDEANALGVKNGDEVEIVRDNYGE